MLEALRQLVAGAAGARADVVLLAFDASAINYRARFWIDDYAADDAARDEVRTAIYYSFQRHGIEIPWPIQIQYRRSFRTRIRRRREAASRNGCWPASICSRRCRRSSVSELAASTPLAVYGSGETIVRQGEAGQSMFVVCSGAVRVVLEPARQEVARIERGGYFGEMSLLTGEPRSATVLAVGDVIVVEIGAELFRRIAARESRRRSSRSAWPRWRAGPASNRCRTATAGAVTVETTTLLARMKKFLRSAAIQADDPAAAYPFSAPRTASSSRYARSYPSWNPRRYCTSIRFLRSVALS